MEKIAGVWQTAEPMSMLVVKRVATAGCRDMPRQHWPPGNPEPTPEPKAPKPMLRPAPNKAAAFKGLVLGIFIKSSKIEITRANMDADSATA